MTGQRRLRKRADPPGQKDSRMLSPRQVKRAAGNLHKQPGALTDPENKNERYGGSAFSFSKKTESRRRRRPENSAQVENRLTQDFFVQVT